jgi:DNA mismatch repair protein MutS2
MKEKDLRLVGKKTSLNPSISIDLVSENGITQKEKEHPVFELRLLGMYAQDAIKALEHQIDLCTLQNFSYFSVIHGKGNGILRQLIRQQLSKMSCVQQMQDASLETGGHGITRVTLR